MKALFCAYCYAIIGLPPDTRAVTCRCAGGRCRGRWVDPARGFAIFTEVAQGGAERDDRAEPVETPNCRYCGRRGRREGNRRSCEPCGAGWPNMSSRYHKRGTAISQPRALYVLVIHNAVLTYGDSNRLDHVAVARASGQSLFAQRDSLIVRFRPGQSSDTAYVTVDEFERGTFPEDALTWIPEDRRVYTDP